MSLVANSRAVAETSSVICPGFVNHGEELRQADQPWKSKVLPWPQATVFQAEVDLLRNS